MMLAQRYLEVTLFLLASCSPTPLSMFFVTPARVPKFVGRMPYFGI